MRIILEGGVSGVMKKNKYVFAALLLVMASFAWAAKPILNIVDEPLPLRVDSSSATLDDVKKAIISGCLEKGWTPVADGDTQIKCSILVHGKHYAEVVIPYSESSFSILYSDSRVLDYNEKKQRIHRNYNNWVLNLSQSIKRQFSSI